MWLVAIATTTPAAAQPAPNQVPLKKLMYDLNLQENSQLRLAANYEFIKLLVQTLKNPNSFGFTFDSLTAISVQKPTDNAFRIFTWQVPMDGGVFKHFGAIQMNTKTLQLIALTDVSDSISPPDEVVLKNGRWAGCVYYQIAPPKKQGKTTYYTLLGWDEHEPFSTKRIIDVLYFEDKKPVFGAPIFKTTQEGIKTRQIFEYSEDASLTLRYDAKQKAIVTDNLVPQRPENQGLYFDYVPDLSLNAYKYTDGMWVMQENFVPKKETRRRIFQKK
jgi:hypothetical protein